MKWSFRIAEIRGIGIFVHATFLVLVAIVVASHWAADRDLAKALEGAVFMLALFGCIVLHELGHALTAARFGIRTRDITLYPIGGVARLERMPEEPRHELAVALAGPAVNVAIAGLLFAGLRLAGVPIPFADALGSANPVLVRLMWLNCGLAAFNLLPAFPMDGGRVLRAALATRLDYTRATQIAAGAGQAMALLFGLIGFFANPFLMFIALFVWIGAAQEAGLVEMRAALRGLSVARAMETRIRTLAPEDPLARAVEETLASAQQDFPVLERGVLIGLLTRQDLLLGLANRGADAAVAGSMQRDVPRLASDEGLEAAFRRIEERGLRTLPVFEGDALVGLLTLDNVGDLLAIRSALRLQPQGARRAGGEPTRR